MRKMVNNNQYITQVLQNGNGINISKETLPSNDLTTYNLLRLAEKGCDKLYKDIINIKELLISQYKLFENDIR